MRGERMFKILSALESGKDASIDVLGSYLLAGMSHNPKKSLQSVNNFIDSRKESRKKKEEDRQEIRRFYSFVSYLKQDGLIRKEKITGKMTISITDKGKRKLEFLKESYSIQLPSFRYEYESEEGVGRDSVVTIVTFDVPEKERSKRDWLRCALNNMDFNMVHKSVWMKSGQIPERFLDDLKSMKMAKYLEIFAVAKNGSLRKVV
jgi:DNA-binding transcriptional regulator PaaX